MSSFTPSSFCKTTDSEEVAVAKKKVGLRKQNVKRDISSDSSSQKEQEGLFVQSSTLFSKKTISKKMQEKLKQKMSEKLATNIKEANTNALKNLR